MTPQQTAVAEQVDAFWRERGWLPAISPFKNSLHVHAVGVDDLERRAICVSGEVGRICVLAEGLQLLKPICRRCLIVHLYRRHGLRVRPWWEEEAA